MRAMSLGLIKGSIDEVDQVVHVTFIKVRSLIRCRRAMLLLHHTPLLMRLCGLRGSCSLDIQPRVLSSEQIANLQERTAGWSEKVKTSLLFVEEHTREIFA
jgi:hypothetical protein